MLYQGKASKLVNLQPKDMPKYGTNKDKDLGLTEILYCKIEIS